MLFYVGTSLMFETHTPWFLPAFVSLYSHDGYWRIPVPSVNVNLLTRGTFLSFQMKLIRSGVVKGEPGLSISSLYCPTLPAKPSFSISHWGLSNPQHLSHFTTLMVESRLVWRAQCSSVPASETASRHLKVLSSVILCIYLFNLFVRTLLKLITGVFALSLWEYLHG